MVVNHDPRGRILPGGSLGSFLFILSYDSIQNNPETSKCVYFRSSGLSINTNSLQTLFNLSIFFILSKPLYNTFLSFQSPPRLLAANLHCIIFLLITTLQIHAPSISVPHVQSRTKGSP